MSAGIARVVERELVQVGAWFRICTVNTISMCAVTWIHGDKSLDSAHTPLPELFMLYIVCLQLLTCIHYTLNSCQQN